jgi:hypothetical protein
VKGVGAFVLIDSVFPFESQMPPLNFKILYQPVLNRPNLK